MSIPTTHTYILILYCTPIYSYVLLSFISGLGERKVVTLRTTPSGLAGKDLCYGPTFGRDCSGRDSYPPHDQEPTRPRWRSTRDSTRTGSGPVRRCIGFFSLFNNQQHLYSIHIRCFPPRVPNRSRDRNLRARPITFGAKKPWLCCSSVFSSSIANFEIAMSQQLILRVKRLSPNAVLPFRATVGAAGYDLCRFAPKDWPNGLGGLMIALFLFQFHAW